MKPVLALTIVSLAILSIPKSSTAERHYSHCHADHHPKITPTPTPESVKMVPSPAAIPASLAVPVKMVSSPSIAPKATVSLKMVLSPLPQIGQSPVIQASLAVLPKTVPSPATALPHQMGRSSAIPTSVAVPLKAVPSQAKPAPAAVSHQTGPSLNGLIARLNRIEERLRRELVLLQDQLNHNAEAQKAANELEKKVTSLKNGISSSQNRPSIIHQAISAAAAVGRPTECVDLFNKGHFLNGFYPVLQKDKMDFVFCNFTILSLPHHQIKATDLEIRTGSADVKTFPVYFHVRRQSTFNANATMPFQIEMLNIGNAMNMTSGAFTAPKAGLYHFTYSGVTTGKAEANWVYLQLNGSTTKASTHGTRNLGWFVLSLEAPLKLQAGDRVSLLHYGTGGGLVDAGGHQFNGFSGELTEEYLTI